jgi:beta-lactamase class A
MTWFSVLALLPMSSLSNSVIPQFQTGIEEVVKRTMSAFPDLKADQFAMTYWVLDRKNGKYAGSHYNGDQPMYPASVVKMFYMAYAHQLLELRKLKTDPELERAIKDMIVESNNDATGLVLDTVTGTTGGSYLPEGELKKWMHKRSAVNRWLSDLGYKGINCNQKTWNEGPYGRERQGYGPNFELRNSLTTNACSRMMAEIMLDKLVSPARCEAMRSLMSRKPASKDSQVPGFIGEVTPASSQLWSKAGWTSTVRHDVACVKRGDQEIVICIFTKYKVEDPKLMKFIATQLLAL